MAVDIDHSRVPLFQETAIRIGKPELIIIKDIASRHWRDRIMPLDMPQEHWMCLMYVTAVQDFLHSRGCKLQFKVEV